MAISKKKGDVPLIAWWFSIEIDGLPILNNHMVSSFPGFPPHVPHVLSPHESHGRAEGLAVAQGTQQAVERDQVGLQAPEVTGWL